MGLRLLEPLRSKGHEDRRHHCVHIASFKTVIEFLHLVECLTPLLKCFFELALFG